MLSESKSVNMNENCLVYPTNYLSYFSERLFLFVQCTEPFCILLAIELVIQNQVQTLFSL